MHGTLCKAEDILSHKKVQSDRSSLWTFVLHSDAELCFEGGFFCCFFCSCFFDGLVDWQANLDHFFTEFVFVIAVVVEFDDWVPWVDVTFCTTVVDHVTGWAHEDADGVHEFAHWEVDQERANEGEDVNGCYLRVELETRNYEHIAQIRKALTDAGYSIE